MGVFKEIVRADDTGTTTFYRLDNQRDTVETDGDDVTKDMIDYDKVLNKPSINGVTLVGDKTSEELGLQPAGDYLTEVPEEYITEEELEAMDYADKEYVKQAINEIEHFHREIVDALPTIGKDNVLYLVKKEGTQGDIYNEYIWTGTDYEFMGTTAADLTNIYTIPEVNDLLNTKVDKDPGKALSTNDFTNELKTKLEGLENYDDTDIWNQVNQLHNYDDTEVQKRLDELEAGASTDEEDISKLEETVAEKLEAVFLIKSGDAWIWQNRKGDNITFEQAQQLLELENYILVIEYLETDGKITPRQFISLDDRMHVYYTDEDNREHILTLGAEISDEILGHEVSYKSSVPNEESLPINPVPGTICVTEDDENIHIFTGTKWVAANPNALIDLTQFLSKTNTIAYTPTSDYHPATKKYVDDSIATLDSQKKIPTKLSQLENDMNFIPKDTTDLVNYYTRSNLYTRAEVDLMISQIKSEGRFHTYDWDSKTYEANPNDMLAMQVLLDEYLNGEVYNLILKLKDIKDDFNGLYGIWEYRFDGAEGHLYMCSGDKTYTFVKDTNKGAQLVCSNAILDIEFEDREGPYVVTSATLRRKEDVLDTYLSMTTTTDVDYTPTLNGHPATKKYVDDTTNTAASNTLTDAKAYTDSEAARVTNEYKQAIQALTENEINPLKQADTQNVKITGDQAVAGTKTFSASPKVPTPVAEEDAVNKRYVDNIKGSLEGNVTDINNRLDTLDSNITNVDNRVTELDEKVDAAVGEINGTITKEVQELNNTINSNVETLNNTITSNVETLNTTIETNVTELETKINDNSTADQKYADEQVKALKGTLATVATTGSYNDLLDVPEEEDPTVPDHVKGITQQDIANWNAKQAAGDYALKDDLPTKVSQLTNDSEYITKDVDNLTNYDLSTTVDTKIATAISQIDKLEKKIVTSIEEVTTEDIIYMVPKTESDDNDYFDEYMLINGKPELLGSTKIDLSGYVKLTDLEAMLKNYPTVQQMNAAIADTSAVLDGLVVENRKNSDKVKIILSDDKPTEEEGYHTLWVDTSA